MLFIDVFVPDLYPVQRADSDDVFAHTALLYKRGIERDPALLVLGKRLRRREDRAFYVVHIGIQHIGVGKPTFNEFVEILAGIHEKAFFETAKYHRSVSEQLAKRRRYP